MTISEMQELTDDFLTVKQVSTCLHCDPQLIRDQAEQDVKLLGFPVSRIGHSIKIPRLGFIDWAKTGRSIVVLDGAVCGSLESDESIRDAIKRMVMEILHTNIGIGIIKETIREYVDELFKAESEST